MKNKIISLNKLNINKKHYFQDLLTKLKSKNLLPQKTLNNINTNIIVLLKEEVSRYNQYGSSSIKIHIGESILLSIYYILGLRLMTCNTIEEHIATLKNNTIQDLYNEGKAILNDLISHSKELYKEAINTKIKTTNYSYNDTLCDDGIGLFFNNYNKEFFSHEADGNIDYQLFIDIMDLPGATYINNYLKLIILENTYCNYFSYNDIEELLNSYHKDNCHLLINIFQFVYFNSIASTLLKKPATNLKLNNSEVLYLENMLSTLNNDELQKIIYTAIDLNIKNLNITNSQLINYLHDAKDKIIHSIKNQKRIFIPNTNRENNYFSFIDNPTMDNSKFKDIQEELTKCVTITEKINIINYEINSLYDLIDILKSNCIYQEEYQPIFKSFDTNKLSLIYKFITTNNYEYYIFNKFDKDSWEYFFFQFINSLTSIEKNNIISLSKNIEFN